MKAKKWSLITTSFHELPEWQLRCDGQTMADRLDKTKGDVLVKALNAYESDQKKIEDLLAVCELMIDTAAPCMIIAMAKEQDSPQLEGYAAVLEGLLNNMQVVIAKIRGEG